MSERSAGLSRRGFLGAAGLASAGAAAGMVVRPDLLALGTAAAAAPGALDAIVEFHGEHQAGIVTPAQDRLFFAAFDVTTSRRAELVELLRAWTVAARRR